MPRKNGANSEEMVAAVTGFPLLGHFAQTLAGFPKEEHP
jgi:hypothetical protein